MAIAARAIKAILVFQMGVALIAVAAPAHARPASQIARQIRAMQREMVAQRRLIESQATLLSAQQLEIDRLRTRMVAAAPANAPHAVAVAQSASPAAPPALPTASAATLPRQPVGEAPALARVEQQVEAVPQGQGVLTRAGRFVLEPSLEYTNSSNNRLVFRGIELIPGIQVGLIEASDARRDTLVATAGVRYGITDRLELEASVPYLFRHDRIEAVQQSDDSTTRTSSLSGHDIGDAQFGLRYQFNRPLGERPIFVGSVRVKTATGKSPFSVPFDEFGVATGLATGSGFWAVQPGISFLLPSDPAVIFGGVSYLHQIPRTIDRTVGEVRIGRVKPGGAIGGNLGFGFALNPRFSFSLGYRHTYLAPTRTEIGDIISRSTPLQVGSFTAGMSYRLTPQQSLDFGLEVGATKDAPDVSLVLRAPFSSK